MGGGGERRVVSLSGKPFSFFFYNSRSAVFTLKPSSRAANFIYSVSAVPPRFLLFFRCPGIIVKTRKSEILYFHERINVFSGQLRYFSYKFHCDGKPSGSASSSQTIRIDRRRLWISFLVDIVGTFFVFSPSLPPSSPPIMFFNLLFTLYK